MSLEQVKLDLQQIKTKMETEKLEHQEKELYQQLEFLSRPVENEFHGYRYRVTSPEKLRSLRKSTVYQITAVYGVPLKPSELLMFFKHFANQPGTECANLLKDRTVSAEDILLTFATEMMEALDFDLDGRRIGFYPTLKEDYCGILGFLAHEGRYEAIPLHMAVKESPSHLGKKERLVALLSSVTGERIRYNLLLNYAMHLIIRES